MQVRFPFVGGQGGLDPAFQADTSACNNTTDSRTIGTPPDNSDDREPIIREEEESSCTF